jgi:hypothetical protein
VKVTFGDVPERPVLSLTTQLIVQIAVAPAPTEAVTVVVALVGALIVNVWPSDETIAHA